MRNRLIGIVLGAALCNVAAATPPNMSLADYLARKKQISVDYRAAQAACGANPSSNREVCRAEAMGRDGVAKADLEVAYRSTPRTRYEANEARADALFWVARERCDDSGRLLRDTCLRDAKEARLAARSSASLRMHAAETDQYNTQIHGAK